MYLEKLQLLNFKNYTDAELEFSPSVNCFAGNNGAGKTNLLDGIHYLSLCKSYFNPIDSQQIRYGQDLFVIQGTFNKNEAEEKVYCGLKRNQKKQFKRNKKEYQRLADHIGLFPLVMISPNDGELVTGGSEERRKFVDNVISQTDNSYLDTLIQYNKTLSGRNALLRSDGAGYDPDLLEVFDEQLVRYGEIIYRKRSEFLELFTRLFHTHYEFITGNAESIALKYESGLSSTEFAEGLRRARERDYHLQRSTFGIHKDDLVFSIEEHPLKKFGSQGQQKSFLIALKLGQYSYLFEKKGFKPLLLLDDIFDKLDGLRIKRLMEMVVKDNFGQLFLTDTDPERLEKLFGEIGVPAKIFRIDGGTIR
ncbi:DNA replication and repair protein RecF [Anseongella ginsenosidimutans]|uniref:DNA replication and repair protein RecF n=1 Tax=Anseongella ginsenosidimutans TaxID=496056 RepID=A0A4R3KLT7_9SPHI|nr:DNA replication/repair protein RecF [Anseongella ginsenosidimutans]QEC54088.1 DNA replication/repair protein RecF [Anseongella ginsenosidimutans]TCS85142.1 DNA replication and repair protein RecF [Anseongella ginsenosidimutans]